MVMSVGQRRQGQQAADARLCRLDSDNTVAVNSDDMRTGCRRIGVGLNMATDQFTHRHGPAA
jgi:hypothetical protein